ncbi:MAG: hypothetical protein KDC98_09915 [Planctomycetes bacterium]|nr:hypothetical protein [Planctomycetota bacterium]
MSRIPSPWLIATLSLAALSLAACSPGNDPPNVEPIESLVRVRNATTHDFDAVTVNGVSYGAVAAGAESDYQVLLDAYEIAAIQVQTDVGAFLIQPIDTVGEPRLGNGMFTYVLGLDDEAHPVQLFMTTVRDG